MKNTTYFGTDWNHVDMNSPSDTSRVLIDGLTFDTLLMEIECNCPKIDVEAITRQFQEDLQSRVSSAWEVFSANRDALLRKALQVRNTP